MSTIFDDTLRRAFPDGSPIRYLQIGGNDGICRDPLYQHHVDGKLNFEWGHVFEPVLEYFEQLVRNMRPFPYVSCHALAVDVSATPGKRIFSYVSLDDIEKHALPTSAKGIASFSLSKDTHEGMSYPERKFERLKEYIRSVEVDTIPIRDVTSDYSGANLLVTDCEGHDVELISAAFRDNGFRPKVVQFEHAAHGDEASKSVLVTLNKLGYGVTRSGKDYICELS
jgi:FkbM family methyltransferase